MITLETEFFSGSGGFTPPLKYTQLQRNGIYAMYQRFTPEGVKKDIEVIVTNTVPKGTVQKFPGGVIKVTEDDAEHYATTSLWGKRGWSFHGVRALEGATAKFNELVNEVVPIIEPTEDVAGEVAPITSNGRRGRAPKARVALNIPVGEFSTKNLAEFNQVEYADAVFFINEQLAANSVRFVKEERRTAKGKPSKIFAKVG